MAKKKDAATPAHIELIPATPEQKPILANLLELYAHDFSEFHNMALQEDGRFGYTDLPLYWRETSRHPFLVRVDGNWAGFVLVKKSEVAKKETVWDVAEFFVARGYRQRGIGTAVAHQVWKLFPGPWQVRVMDSNPAAKFWDRTVQRFIGRAVKAGSVDVDGVHWKVFSFESVGS